MEPLLGTSPPHPNPLPHKLLRSDGSSRWPSISRNNLRGRGDVRPAIFTTLPLRPTPTPGEHGCFAFTNEHNGVSVGWHLLSFCFVPLVCVTLWAVSTHLPFKRSSVGRTG